LTRGWCSAVQEFGKKYPANVIYLAVSWYRRDTVKDLKTLSIPEGVRVILDVEGKNTAEILKMNDKLIPMMILVVDNNCKIEYVFSWNYDSKFEEGELEKVLAGIEGFIATD
jgi:hypothetical protein